jgi:hypothetical protein
MGVSATAAAAAVFVQAAGAIESAFAITYNRLPNLSEQQVGKRCAMQ